jgi:hypothetical protein
MVETGLFLVLSHLLGAGVAVGVYHWCRADRGKERSDADVQGFQEQPPSCRAPHDGDYACSPILSVGGRCQSRSLG